MPLRPRLTVAQILRWADSHHARTGHWPRVRDNDHASLPAGENWCAIDTALAQGHRGLRGGDTLRCLLRRERGVRPRLTHRLILSWADEHHAQTGLWPTDASGPVAGMPGQTWAAVNEALREGFRGLPGGDGLSQLLRRHGRGARPGPRLRAAKADGRPASSTPKGHRHTDHRP
jgi:hypothetical protein